MTSTLQHTVGRDAILEGVRRFAEQHGLDAGDDMNSLLRKFLVVTANGANLDVAYPLIGDDMEAVKFRGRKHSDTYRSTNSSGYIYPPEAWDFLFSTADVGDLLDTSSGGSSDTELEPYRFFRAALAGKVKRNATLPEWKSALAYYLASQECRNGYQVSRDVIEVQHPIIQEIAAELSPDEYARGLSAMLNHVSFGAVNDSGFKMVLRNPGNGRGSQNSRNGHNDGVRGANPWDAPLKTTTDVVSEVKTTPAKPWELANKMAYREIPVIRETAERVGAFVPLDTVFKHVVNAEHAEPDAVAIDAQQWANVLSVCDHIPDTKKAMQSKEMRDFLTEVAGSISTKDFAHWTDREAIKKLLTVHAKDWESKWKTNWTIDEALRRAIMAHTSKYSSPNKEFVDAVSLRA